MGNPYIIKPYITWAFMGYFIPKNPWLHVRERGTPNCPLRTVAVALAAAISLAADR